MTGLRLSTDILSPINSDFSINDDSTLSFECSASTLDFEKHLKSLGNRPHQKGSSFKISAKNSTNEKDASFEMILGDIKRQSDINTEKEEKCRDTYKQLKQSMDGLFYSKASNSDFPSPVKKQLDLESICNTENITYGLKTEKREFKQQTPEAAIEMCLPSSTVECISEIPITKLQENGNKTKKDRKSNRLSKNDPHSKEAGKASRNKVNVRNEKDVKSSDVRQERQRLKAPEISSSIQTSETTKEKKKVQSLMSQFGNQKKDVPLTVPSIENKTMSFEKSVQIAISMQLDGIRNLMLDQNISLRKEMLILQETARKQNQVTKYLFSVVEELLETNKKLISKLD